MIIDGETRLLEAAARWHLRLEENVGDAALQSNFRAWLDRDPRHLTAFDDVARSLAGVDGQEDALVLAAGANEMTGRLRRRHRLVSGAISMGTVVFLGIAAVTLWPTPAPVTRTYAATDFGIRTVLLSDRSEIVLDRGATVRVAYSDSRRRIELVEGQAQFKVAHDVSRPFEVVAQRRVVVATGTDFMVDRSLGQLKVALLSGGVEVSVEPDCPGPIGALCHFMRRDRYALRPGESLSGPINRGSLVRARISKTDASAWKVGLLIAHNEELRSLVERLNRYAVSGNTISIGDPALGRLRVDGAYRIGNPHAVGSVLETLLNIKADLNRDGSVVLREKLGAN